MQSVMGFLLNELSLWRVMTITTGEWPRNGKGLEKAMFHAPGGG